MRPALLHFGVRDAADEAAGEDVAVGVEGVRELGGGGGGLGVAVYWVGV